MKTRHFLFLFIIFFAVNSCKKDGSQPGASYQTLGTYDASGKPNNLLKDSISASFQSFADSSLPNGINLKYTHPELLTDTAIADIVITQSSNVYLTFVHGVSGFSNSLAFYTYPTNQPPLKAGDIKLITYILPNCGLFTTLQPGDKVNLGNFTAGTTIGFVLMQNAWDLNKHTLDNNATHFYTTDALNPEVDPSLKKHAILLNYPPENKELIGFEDTNRSSPQCDNDFNDVVFYCTVGL